MKDVSTVPIATPVPSNLPTQKPVLRSFPTTVKCSKSIYLLVDTFTLL